MSAPKKPARARARGRIWSFRNKDVALDVRIKGYPTRRHRKAERDIALPAYIVIDLQRLGLNITIDLALTDARRVYADLGAAIATAETTTVCDADCWTCEQQVK